MNKKELFLLLIILTLAFFLRFYKLADNPPSLNWDEVSHGYNGYSILRTGKDEWGIKFPAVFRAYGDYKLPVYIYLVVASERLFGLNEMAVRLPSVIAGTLSVLFTYLLVKELFANSVHLRGVHSATSEVSLGLIAALLLAVEPWDLFLSRVAVEANVALFLIIAAAYFFLKGLKSGWWLVISGGFFGLSLFTYNSARLFVPLLVFALTLLYYDSVLKNKKGREKKVLVLALVVFLLFLGRMLASLFSSSGRARYQWVRLLDQGAIARINQDRAQSGLPGSLPRLAHNKGTYFTAQFARNYLAHFFPDFLFLRGGSHYQFNVPNFGLLYPINVPFILIGFWYLLKNRDQASRVVLAWLFLSPVASSLTRDSPHALRAIVMLPIWQILTAVGVVRVLRVFSNKRVKIIFLVLHLSLITYHLSLFWRVYFNSYRRSYSWAWQFGYKQIVRLIKEKYDQYDKIIITKKYGEPHEFVLFYWPWEPGEYRNDPNLVRYFRTSWYWVDEFDKFQFVNDWEIKHATRNTQHATRYLLITSPGNYLEGWRKIETVYFLDGKPAFEILENLKPVGPEDF